MSEPIPNLEQLEAKVLPSLAEWLNQNVEREHMSFGQFEGKLACFIEFAGDNQHIVFTTEGTPSK